MFTLLFLNSHEMVSKYSITSLNSNFELPAKIIMFKLVTHYLIC